MAVLHDIPASLLEALQNPPEPGQRNVWLFTVANRASHSASPEKVRAFLYKVAEEWDDRDFGPEIERAVRRAYFENSSEPQERRIPAWPDFNTVAWHQRVKHPHLFPLSPLTIHAEEVIDGLFPGNPLICMSPDIRSALTRPRDHWRGLEASHQFIVANPMTAETGLNQSGQISTRCLDNATKQRIYQVVEFDHGEISEQAAILSSLSNELTPLILVVWSGGKSLHGWFRVSGLSDYAILRFFRHAVYFGADQSLWDPSKLVRMPGGLRENGKTQHVLYFNPKHLPG